MDKYLIFKIKSNIQKVFKASKFEKHVIPTGTIEEKAKTLKNFKLEQKLNFVHGIAYGVQTIIANRSRNIEKVESDFEKEKLFKYEKNKTINSLNFLFFCSGFDFALKDGGWDDDKVEQLFDYFRYHLKKINVNVDLIKQRGEI